MILDETFLDRVVHDLRGELSTMLAGVHYLQRFGRSSTSSPQDMLERVSEAGDRLTRLLEEFDDSVWLLDKPKPLLLAPCRLRVFVDELLEQSNKLSSFRGVRLLLECPDAEHREFVGDADMLIRALLYVVDFAMLRAPHGEIRGKVEFADGFPVVRIEDDGAHIPDKLRSRLLEPFVENELAGLLPQGRRRVRIGLGLAIAQAIFEAHGGTIALEPLGSASDAGLVFCCILAR